MVLNSSLCLLKTWFFLLQFVLPFYKKVLGYGSTCLQISSGFFLDFKIHSKNIYPLVFFFQKHTLCLFEQLVDVVCVDTPQSKYRFLLVYLLQSVIFNFKIRVFAKIRESHSILLSLISLFRSVNWVEREVFDFYGIFFFEHSDLRRILSDYGFLGFPLRKDFPLTGYVDIFFDDTYKKIVYRPLELPQEFRPVDFKWENLWVAGSAEV